MKIESTRGISRLNYKTSANGWLARYTREGVTFSKTFSDSKYGSPEASKTAAESWHKEVRSLFPPMTIDDFYSQIETRTESGIVGVRRVVQMNKGYKYPTWTARWRLNGKENIRSFSVKKYGEEGAKERAVAARRAIEPKLKEEWERNYWNYRPHNLNERGYVDDPFAYEGQREFVLHQRAERDRNLRRMKLDDFLAKHGRIFCEVCSFSFEDAYGEIGAGLIEIHHLVPMADLTVERKTHISELMCLCSNCHLAIHNGDPSENLRRLRVIFEDVSRSDKTRLTNRSRERSQARA